MRLYMQSIDSYKQQPRNYTQKTKPVHVTVKINQQAPVHL